MYSDFEATSTDQLIRAGNAHRESVADVAPIDGSVARSHEIRTVRNASEMTTSASRPAVDRRGATHSDLVAQSGVENRALAVNGAERLLTVDDLCEYLVSEDFIYDEARHGRLGASRIARQLRFRPADVDAFVAANAVTGCDL